MNNIKYQEKLLMIKNGLLKKETAAKERKPIPKISKKRLKENIIKKELLQQGETELQKWYIDIMKKEKPICWETGELINTNDELGWIGSIAHILPKKQYKSVATHPLNYMILKMWGGTHSMYDSSWEKASKMKVWSYACKIFNTLYPLLTNEEKAKLPDIIRKEIKSKYKNEYLQ